MAGAAIVVVSFIAASAAGAALVRLGNELDGEPPGSAVELLV